MDETPHGLWESIGKDKDDGQEGDTEYLPKALWGLHLDEGQGAGQPPFPLPQRYNSLNLFVSHCTLLPRMLPTSLTKDFPG